MIKFISVFILAFTFSPLWPLGQNPLPGDPFIIVNKKTNEVAYFHEGRVQSVVKAATGKRNDLTPEGLYTITVKVEQPYYRRKNIPGGHPNNPLGTRWIGFDAENTDGRTYGIHGTNNPNSIGKYVSQGCIRLHNDVVERFYDRIPLGTKVLIISTNKSFEQLGKEYGAIYSPKINPLLFEK
ncbi:L,D-transpeptidase [Bacillus aquiflavi]|uniref:L,D-transpeptidase n=1 Tax=Bacillus aquiflavi TaxID=2672567 RepID=A0A6B3W3L8_9BACI|nr:L,D-transpeptidase [Bacillus aquiflavi]MBA4538214.1 L,D-transpeptidase [Bacillus aquiflavi]NEY82533.1 L,D-transpeptidase [Bacillus aquiflavi]